MQRNIPTAFSPVARPVVTGLSGKMSPKQKARQFLVQPQISGRKTALCSESETPILLQTKRHPASSSSGRHAAPFQRYWMPHRLPVGSARSAAAMRETLLPVPAAPASSHHKKNPKRSGHSIHNTDNYGLPILWKAPQSVFWLLQVPWFFVPSCCRFCRFSLYHTTIENSTGYPILFPKTGHLFSVPCYYTIIFLGFQAVCSKISSSRNKSTKPVWLQSFSPIFCKKALTSRKNLLYYSYMATMELTVLPSPHREHTAGGMYAAKKRVLLRSCFRKRKRMFCVKNNEECRYRLHLNLGGNTNAFVPFGGEGFFL